MTPHPTLSSLRLAFLGTPPFAAEALKALIEKKHTIVAVFSQPPKPLGRGYQVQKSPVHLLAESHQIPVYTPTTLKDEQIQDLLKSLELDLAIVAAYGLLLPFSVLKIPRWGCVNIHASLLPRWRGASPIQRAIQAGDHETGITLMQMDPGLDTGDILVQEALPITPTTTAETLQTDLARLGAQMLEAFLDRLCVGSITPQKQDERHATHAPKLTKEEGHLDWTKPAIALERQIRAFVPWPGSFFEWNGKQIKVLAAQVLEVKGMAGKVLAAKDTLVIACGEGALKCNSLQAPGKKAMSAKDFLNGHALPMGERLR
jgi:methionyl-tRNA formyltransferase